MKQILTCNTCNKLFISEVNATTCPKCLSNSEKNDDPMNVAPINIMKLVLEFEKLTKPRNIVNALRELDFVTSQAYSRGYISEEFYEEVCEELGLEPRWDKPTTLSGDDYYDYSISARVGFYQDMFEGGED
jgi:hypothetical protein